MKTFDDLVFKPHRIAIEYKKIIEDERFFPKDEGLSDHMKKCLDATYCHINFDNGYGLSIISGEIFYTSEEGPYEVGILHNGELDHTTELTEDVLGHQSKEDVENLLKIVQSWPKKEK